MLRTTTTLSQHHRRGDAPWTTSACACTRRRDGGRGTTPWRSALARAGFGGLTKREHSIGVSVKETSSDTAMANAEVKPNELMNRPTIPPMKPTGRNTASSDNVVAITASPISLVP